MHFTVRPYVDDDWDAIASIHDRARLDELRLTVGLEAFRTLEQTAQDEGLFDGGLWVAADGARIGGFVATDEDEVTWLYVDPDLYGSGIGRLLLRYAVAQIGANPTTSVLVGNAPAIALYQSEGFEIVETIEGHLAGLSDVPAKGHTMRLNSPR